MSETILRAWRAACAFLDGPDGNLVIVAVGVGVAICLLRWDPRVRGMLGRSS